MTTGKCLWLLVSQKTEQPGIILQLFTEQEGMGWSVLTWMSLLPPKRMPASKLTTGNGLGPQPSPEPCKGAAGSCCFLWARKSLKDKFKASLSQC